MRDFAKSLLRGEVSLRRTYWGWFVLGGLLLDLPAFIWMAWIVSTTAAHFEDVGVGLNLAGQVLNYSVQGIPASMVNTALTGFLSFRLLATMYRLFMVVPVWNSAGKYKGRKLWLVLARISAVVVAIGNLGNLYDISTSLVRLLSN